MDKVQTGCSGDCFNNGYVGGSDIIPDDVLANLDRVIISKETFLLTKSIDDKMINDEKTIVLTRINPRGSLKLDSLKMGENGVTYEGEENGYHKLLFQDPENKCVYTALIRKKPQEDSSPKKWDGFI